MEQNEALQITLDSLRRELQVSVAEVEKAQKEIAAVQARLAEAQAEADRTRQVIDFLQQKGQGRPATGQTTLETSDGETGPITRPTPAGPPRPSTSEAVLRVLADSPVPMTVPEITDEIENRGWASTRSTNFRASVRQSVLRLYGVHHKLARPTTGHYELATESSVPEQPDEQPQSAPRPSSTLP